MTVPAVKQQNATHEHAHSAKRTCTATAAAACLTSKERSPASLSKEPVCHFTGSSRNSVPSRKDASATTDRLHADTASSTRHTAKAARTYV